MSLYVWNVSMESIERTWSQRNELLLLNSKAVGSVNIHEIKSCGVNQQGQKYLPKSWICEEPDQRICGDVNQ